MNILLLAPQPFYQDRGTPIAIKMAVEILTASGHTLHVLTYHEGDTPAIPGCTIYRIPRVFCIRDIKPGFSLKKLICDSVMFIYAPRFIKRISPDLIHAVEESVFIAWLAKKLYRIPYIYDMDSSLVGQLIEKYGFLKFIAPAFRFLEKRAIKGSEGVIAVCKMLETRVRECSPQTPVVCLEDIPLPVAVNVDVESVRQGSGIESKIVMYIGNLEKYQGIDLLIDAFSRAAARVPAAHLVIIGGRIEDIERYRSRVGKADGNGQLHFIGPRPARDLYGYLAQADVLVSPRVRGINTPMKIYSYLNSGVPVLATALPTHTQVLDKTVAYLVKPDAESMSAGLIELLENDGLRKELSSAAKELVERKYSFEAYRVKLASFYDEMRLKAGKR